MHYRTSEALQAWAITAGVAAACAAVTVMFGSFSSCVTSEHNARTDRVRSTNDALVKMVGNGANPIAARCAIERDTTSAPCIAVATKPNER